MSSFDVKVFVTHITDPLNFLARIGTGMLFFDFVISVKYDILYSENLKLVTNAGSVNSFIHTSVLTTRHYASVVYAVVVCLSICLCICLSQVSVLLKWLNIGSHK